MDRMKLTVLYEKFMVVVDLLASSPASLQKFLGGFGRRLFYTIQPSSRALWLAAFQARA